MGPQLNASCAKRAASAAVLDLCGLDASKRAAKATRKMTEHLAKLAKKLESDGHPQELVATFLMRCLFMMFAEDVGLLPDGAFTKAIEDVWLPDPESFRGGFESLWRTMDEGGHLSGAGTALAAAARAASENVRKLPILAKNRDSASYLWVGLELCSPSTVSLVPTISNRRPCSGPLSPRGRGLG